MTNHSGLSDKVLATVEVAAQVAASGVNGTGVDMKGYDGVAFYINLGAFTGSAAFDARVVQADNSGFTNATNVTNAALTQVANTSNTNLAVIDVFRPTQRYLRVVATPTVNNVAVAVTAHRYRRTGVLPPTQAAIQHVKVIAN